MRPFFHHKIPLFQQYLDTDEELGLLMVDSVLILLSLTMQTSVYDFYRNYFLAGKLMMY